MKKEVFFGSLNENTPIQVVIEHYEKVGRGWYLIGIDIDMVDRQYYINTLQAKQFFVNLGGIERYSKSYTAYGYLVTRISSISPDKEQKTVRKFKFGTEI